MKKKFLLLLCSSGNEAFAVGNVIIGSKKYLLQNLKESCYDIMLITDFLDSKDEKALKSIFEKIIIVKNYKPKFSKKMMNSREAAYFSVFTFARFELFNLLNDYEKILYTDSDVVIQKDISHLLNIESNFSSVYFPDKSPVKINFSKESFPLVDKKYNMERASLIAAFLFITDKIKDFTLFTNWCYEKAEEYNTNDQSIINLLVQEFSIKVNDLTESYGCFGDSPNAENAHIVHAIGAIKFWRGRYNKEWEDNNKVWLSLGGRDTYKETEIKRKKVNKIVWFIPIRSLRDKVRLKILKSMGIAGR